MAPEVTVGVGRGVRRPGLLIELGAIRWGPVAGASAAATLLAVLDLTVWPRGPGSMLTWLCAALLGGAAALAFDQPASSVTQATPYPAGLRIASRLLVVAGGGVGWSAYAWTVADGQPQSVSVSWTALTLVGAGLLLIGPAASLVLSGPDNRDPGALVASVLVAIVIGLLVVPLPGDVDPFDVADAWTKATAIWGVVAVACAAVLMQSSRR